MPEPDRLTQKRIARNNDTFRQANEQISRAARANAVEQVPFICECANECCTAVVRLSPAQYAEIGASARQFFSSPTICRQRKAASAWSPIATRT